MIQKKELEDAVVPENAPVIVKIGSSSIIDERTNNVSLKLLSQLVESLYNLQQSGRKVILVSSGSVGIGTLWLKGPRPKSLPERQAAAAVGQGKLMQVYTDLFSYFDQSIAQILLSRHDLADKSRFNNAKNTIEELLKRDIIPILNENDTTSTESLRFSDNDTLAAMVAGMIQAKWLFLLTDVDGLYDSNPHTNPEAVRIPIVTDIDETCLKVNMSEHTSSWGTGGMTSKISAARLAVAGGCNTVVLKAQNSSFITSMVIDGQRSHGTVFMGSENPISEAKRYISHGLRPLGRIFIDDGAKKAVLNKYNLYAAGIVKVEGRFEISNGVRIVGSDGLEIGIGIVNFTSYEISMIAGKHSQDIDDLLGYYAPDCVVYRRHIAITGFHSSPYPPPLSGEEADGESENGKNDEGSIFKNGASSSSSSDDDECKN